MSELLKWLKQKKNARACGEETPSRDFTWSQDRNDTLRTRRERATIFKP
jgi:hypothetical protein